MCSCMHRRIYAAPKSCRHTLMTVSPITAALLRLLAAIGWIATNWSVEAVDSSRTAELVSLGRFLDRRCCSTCSNNSRVRTDVHFYCSCVVSPGCQQQQARAVPHNMRQPHLVWAVLTDEAWQLDVHIFMPQSWSA